MLDWLEWHLDEKKGNQVWSNLIHLVLEHKWLASVSEEDIVS